MPDILIKNGTIVDGTGAPPCRADIAIEGDRIACIAPALPPDAGAVIDAAGKTVIPGLIDPHVHEEWVLFDDGQYDLFLKQGVTTVINGNCGHSIVPGPKEKIIGYYFNNGLLGFEQRDRYLANWPDWEDFAGYAAAAEAAGTNLNFVTLLGYGTIRELVMGGALPRTPSSEEWAEIERIIRHNMRQGMWGLSFGLDYIPGRYAEIPEMTRICKEIAAFDGVCSAHSRQYAGIPEATAELLEVGRQSGCKLQFSHLRSTCVEAFDMVRRAIEEEGIRARIDTMARSTGHLMSKRRLRQFICAIVDELFNKGEQAVVDALHTPEGRETIKKGAFILAAPKTEIFIVNSADPHLENRSVQDIADERGQDAYECLLDLVGDDNKCTFWLGGPSRADFPVEGHAPDVVSNPYVSAGSDRIMGDYAVDPWDWYELQRIGCQAIFINMYLEKGVPLQEVIRRDTSMIAAHFGIPGRGALKPGNFADIAVLDLPNYKYPYPDQLHYKNPNMRATGVEHVLVNGKFALQNGQTLPAYSGRVLKKA